MEDSGIFIILLIPAFLGALYIFFTGLRQVRNGLDSKNKWAKIQGVISYSKVTDGYKLADTKLSYWYIVDDKKYIGGSLGFDKGEFYKFLDIGGRLNIEFAYPKGKKVVVYYNPDKPSKSCLEPGVKVKYVVSLVAGIGMMTAFIAGAIGIYFM